MSAQQDVHHLRATLLLVLASLLIPSLPLAGEENGPASIGALPAFRHQGVVLDYKDLKYNPCNDIIIPSVIATDQLQKPLGRRVLARGTQAGIRGDEQDRQPENG